MNLLKHVQFTLNKIFDLYIQHRRKHYGFAMTFTILSAIGSAIISFLIVQAHDLVYNPAGDTDRIAGIKFGYNAEVNLQDIYTYVLGMSVGLYVLCLRPWTAERPEKPGFSFVSSKALIAFLLAVIGGSVFILLLNAFLYAPDTSSHSGSELDRMMNLFSYGRSWWMTWLIDIMRYVKFLLPFAVSFFLLRAQLREKGIYTKKANVSSSFWATMVLGFFIQTLSVAVMALIASLIVTPVTIGLSGIGTNLVVLVFVYFLYVFVLAQFFPGLAGSILFPQLYETERELPESRNLDEL